MIVYGQDFPFSIEFSHETAVNLTSSKQWVDTFYSEQARLLSNSQEIASLCIAEKRAYHCERINELRQYPRVFEIGNIVFTKKAVKSNKAKHIIDKTEFAFTGPWDIFRNLKGGSYELRHTRSGNTDKKHAMHINPVPPEMIAFAPLDGIDTKYGQIYTNINDEAYKAAGIHGLLPHNTWKGFTRSITHRPIVAISVAQFVKGEGNNDKPYPEFPTLADLNKELSG